MSFQIPIKSKVYLMNVENGIDYLLMAWRSDRSPFKYPRHLVTVNRSRSECPPGIRNCFVNPNLHITSKIKKIGVRNKIVCT